MRLTRHARNRLRWIARRHPAVSEAGVLQALRRSETAGYDEQGNRRSSVTVGTTRLTVVIDEAEGVIVTLWVR